MLVAALAVAAGCSGSDGASPAITDSTLPVAGSSADPIATVGTATTDAVRDGSVPANAVPAGTATTGTATTDTATTGTATTAVGSVDDLASVTCARTGVVVAGSVASPQLVEASGLVASRRHPGVLWSHNDGDDARLFAVGVDGGDLGEFPLETDGVRDIEDIAAVGSVGGDTLLLADIGDNRLERTSVSIVRVAEPDPSSPGTVSDVEVLTFVYPDRPHDAETLLVDQRTNRLVVVTKEQHVDNAGRPDAVGRTMPSFVFDGSLDEQVAGPATLELVGTIDTIGLEDRVAAPVPHPASLLGFGGMVTGGDVSPDGRLIALRTYEALWLWARADGQSVAEALTTPGALPCLVETAIERQGEAVAFVDDALVTISEGEHPLVHLLAHP